MPESRPSLWSEKHANPANWGWGHACALAGLIAMAGYVHNVHSARLAMGLSAVFLAAFSVPLVILDSWRTIRERWGFRWTLAIIGTMGAVSVATLIWVGQLSVVALTAALSGAWTLLLLRMPRSYER
jgi:hypothetical protein